jgi:hypothetical protein
VVSPNVWNSQVEPFGGKPEAVFGYDNIWTYWWLGSHEDDPHYPKIRDLLTSNFLATLKNNPTAVIFSDVSPRPVITPDGPLGFLMRDPQVREEMSHYTKEKTMDYCTDKEVFGCRFDVYKRQTP